MHQWSSSWKVLVREELRSIIEPAFSDRTAIAFFSSVIDYFINEYRAEEYGLPIAIHAINEAFAESGLPLQVGEIKALRERIERQIQVKHECSSEMLFGLLQDGRIECKDYYRWELHLFILEMMLATTFAPDYHEMITTLLTKSYVHVSRLSDCKAIERFEEILVGHVRACQKSEMGHQLRSFRGFFSHYLFPKRIIERISEVDVLLLRVAAWKFVQLCFENTKAELSFVEELWRDFRSRDFMKISARELSQLSTDANEVSAKLTEELGQGNSTSKHIGLRLVGLLLSLCEQDPELACARVTLTSFGFYSQAVLRDKVLSDVECIAKKVFSIRPSIPSDDRYFSNEETRSE